MGQRRSAAEETFDGPCVVQVLPAVTFVVTHAESLWDLTHKSSLEKGETEDTLLQLANRSESPDAHNCPSCAIPRAVAYICLPSF